jgi:hypothetical protein
VPHLTRGHVCAGIHLASKVNQPKRRVDSFPFHSFSTPIVKILLVVSECAIGWQEINGPKSFFGV